MRATLSKPLCCLFLVGVSCVVSVAATSRAADDSAVDDSAADARPAAEGHELLHATLWMQRSAEYRAICLQTFQWGRALIDQALTDPEWSAALEQMDGEQAGDAGAAPKPPAIIVDVDETMLDNSFYEARLIRDGAEYSAKTWDPWVNEESATALPGAVEFCRYADEKGVTVFYLTNRKAHLTEGTRHNLAARGFPMRAGLDPVLTRTDVKDKGPRRRTITDEYRVLLVVGDNVGDFASTFGETDSAQRAARVDEYAALWGSRWLMLPNPAYGSWEGALLGGDYRLSRAEKLAKKNAALLFDPEVGSAEPRARF